MVTASLTYSLLLSQEQLKGFIEFCDAFDKLFSRHSGSSYREIAKLHDWHQAYLAVCFIKIAHSIFPNVEYSFRLTEKQVSSFKKILAISDSFKKFYSELPQTENDELYQRWVSSFELFRGAIKNTLKKAEK